VHLGGENIASGRWTRAKKERIRASRVGSTRLLAEWIAARVRCDGRPRVFVCASATGYYGNGGDEAFDEDSPVGTGFLAEVCQEWERATAPAAAAGARVVNVRIGMVLGRGGALAKMLLPFRLGLGGRIGDGRQFTSWIELDDLVAVLVRALEDDAFAGPINAVAPHPVTNREFTQTLGRVLRRPTVLPLPAFVARLAFGEMADALLLGGNRVEPARLQAAGHEFRYPRLEAALRRVLGR